MSKMTWKSEAATVAGVLVSLLPLIMGKLPPDSEWVGVIGAVMALMTYVAGWKYEKVGAARNAAMLEASKNPSQP
jgi:hypothetical protein